MSIRGVRPLAGKMRSNSTAVSGCREWKERTRRNKASPARGEQAPRAPLLRRREWQQAAFDQLRRREWQHAACDQLASRARFNPLHLAFKNILVLVFNRGCFCYFCNSQHMRPLWENLNHQEAKSHHPISHPAPAPSIPLSGTPRWGWQLRFPDDEKQPKRPSFEGKRSPCFLSRGDRVQTAGLKGPSSLGAEQRQRRRCGETRVGGKP